MNELIYIKNCLKIGLQNPIKYAKPTQSIWNVTFPDLQIKQKDLGKWKVEK